MTYKFDEDFAGYPPIEQIQPNLAALSSLLGAPGFLARAEDPVWGPGEFVLARASAAIRQHGLCTLTPVWDATLRTYRMDAAEAPATANLGRPLYVAQCYGALTTGQYAWFMTSGITPVNGNATVAADTVYGIAAAGQAGANVAGRQVLNSRIVTPATQTVVKAAISGDVGTRIINVANTDGWFVGGYISGTGIPAASTIVNMDPLGKFVIISADITATVTGNVTVTYNNATIFYNVAHLNRAGAQGAIT